MFFIIFIANNITHPVVINSSDEARLVTNTISYQGELVKPLDNFNAKSCNISCNIHIPYCMYMIEDEADLESVVDDISTPELVCAASQFSDVSNCSNAQVEERNDDESSINKVDSDSMKTEINDNKLKCNFCFPLLFCN